jgi:hypothetical protein
MHFWHLFLWRILPFFAFWILISFQFIIQNMLNTLRKVLKCNIFAIFFIFLATHWRKLCDFASDAIMSKFDWEWLKRIQNDKTNLKQLTLMRTNEDWLDNYSQTVASTDSQLAKSMTQNSIVFGYRFIPNLHGWRKYWSSIDCQFLVWWDLSSTVTNMAYEPNISGFNQKWINLETRDTFSSQIW